MINVNYAAKLMRFPVDLFCFGIENLFAACILLSLHKTFYFPFFFYFCRFINCFLFEYSYIFTTLPLGILGN